MKIEQDKILHLLANLFIVGVGTPILALIGVPLDEAWILSICSAIGVSYTKEYFDSRPGGTGFSFKDLTWDHIGIGIAATLWGLVVILG